MSKNPECMDMPCLCGCGNWFDLNDGFRSKEQNNILVCEECHEAGLKPPAGKKKEDLRKDDIKWIQPDDYEGRYKAHGFYQGLQNKAVSLCNNTRFPIETEDFVSINELEENSEAKYGCKTCKKIYDKLPW